VKEELIRLLLRIEEIDNNEQGQENVRTSVA